VAFVPPVQLATNDVGVMLLMVTTAATGGGTVVVTATLVDRVEPEVFVAVTTKLYVVEAESPVNVAVLPDTLSVEGVTVTVFSLYV